MERTIKINATSETITFVKTSEETKGEYVEIIVTLNAGGKGPGPHIHLKQLETFEIIEGAVGVLKNKEKVVIKPGQKLEIPAGTIHDFWCAENKNIKFKAVLSPALNFEWMLREIFDSCNRKNAADPSPFDGSYVITKMKGEYLLADVPKFVQHYIFPVVAGLGKLLGLVKVRAK